MKLKKINATIIYPIEVNIEIPANATADEVWQSLIEKADKEFDLNSISPVLNKCSDSRLFKKEKPNAPPESQADFIKIIISDARDAQSILSSLSQSIRFLSGVKNHRGENLDSKLNQINLSFKNWFADVISALSPKS